jgi:hypothetical protein
LVDIETGPSVTAQQKWEMRFRKSHDDRVVLTRFLAGCICAVAVVNVLPAVAYWYNWDDIDSVAPMPRWIYLQVFAALLHMVYAVFLIQVADWSSLKAVSWSMLAIAMAFGLLSTGLIVGDGSGFVPRFLELEGTMVRRAGLWCVAMLCVATLASYLGGRESSRWQRAETLLFEVRKKVGNTD